MKQLLEKLFDEKTVKILNEIQDKNQVQVRDISRRTGISPATVFRIFKKLQEITLLKKASAGTFHVYAVNKESDAYSLLEKLLPKTNPIDAFLNELPKDKLENVSVLDEADNRASIMVIGSIKHAIVQQLTEKIRKMYNFSINPLVLSKEQYDNLAALHMKPSPKKVLFEK